MSRVFITGSTDGLGYAAARALIEDGHEVVLHARSQERATAVANLAEKSLSASALLRRDGRHDPESPASLDAVAPRSA